MPNKAILIIALAALAMPLAGAACAAGTTTELELLGKDPGTADAYSCFKRHYDDAHLAAHPRQNVGDLRLLVSSRAPETGMDRQDTVEIAVQFRQVTRQMFIDADCFHNGTLLDCGSGDGFGLVLRGSSQLLLTVDGPTHMYDPTLDGDDPTLPKGARFGSDDRQFELDRANLSECRSVMNDEQVTAILGKGK